MWGLPVTTYVIKIKIIVDIFDYKSTHKVQQHVYIPERFLMQHVKLLEMQGGKLTYPTI